MNRSKIEWCNYSINPIKGLCPMACSYCYARRLYKRFKWNPGIRYEDDAFYGLAELDRNSCYAKNPTKIFVGSTIELFHDSIPEGWLKTIFEYVRLYYHNIYIFLTKQPRNLVKWSPFPKNCYIGVSVTNQAMHNEAIVCLDAIKAKVKFISYEPLLSEISLHSPYDLEGINWLIIGAQTPYSPKTAPKLSWVQKILVAASNASNIPVFMENNLQPVIDHDSLWAGWKLRQEFSK